MKENPTEKAALSDRLIVGGQENPRMYHWPLNMYNSKLERFTFYMRSFAYSGAHTTFELFPAYHQTRHIF